MTDKKIESWPEQIVETAVYFSYPPTPDIAGIVQQRLQPQPAAGKRLRLAVALTGVLILLTVSLLAMPTVRAAVMDWLRIGAIEIFVVEEMPEVETAVPSSIIDLGEAIPLAEAQAIFPYPLRLPADWESSSMVYSQQFLGRTPVVSMQWQTAAGMTVTFSQIAAPYLGMKWAGGEQVRAATVHGQTGVWLEGPHPLQFGTGDFDQRINIDSNVLIWTEDEVTYRLESQLTLDEAVVLAESLP